MILKTMYLIYFRSLQENIVLIETALYGDLVIPEFSQFTKHLEEIYHKCKGNTDGKVSKYCCSYCNILHNNY